MPLASEGCATMTRGGYDQIMSLSKMCQIMSLSNMIPNGLGYCAADYADGPPSDTVFRK